MDRCANDASLKGLCSLLLTGAKKEESLEQLRIDLAYAPDFSHERVFRYLDRSHTGYLTVSDLSQFLLIHDFDIGEHDISVWIRSYSGSFDVMGLGHLTTALTSLQQPPALLAPQNLKRLPKASSLTNDTLAKTAKVVAKDVAWAVKLNRLKQRLSTRHDYSIDAYFKTLDQSRKRCVEAGDLWLLFTRYAPCATRKDLAYVLKYLGVGVAAGLSHANFSRVLLPVSPKRGRSSGKSATLSRNTSAQTSLNSSKSGRADDSTRIIRSSSRQLRKSSQSQSAKTIPAKAYNFEKLLPPKKPLTIPQQPYFRPRPRHNCLFKDLKIDITQEEPPSQTLKHSTSQKSSAFDMSWSSPSSRSKITSLPASRNVSQCTTNLPSPKEGDAVKMMDFRSFMQHFRTSNMEVLKFRMQDLLAPDHPQDNSTQNTAETPVNRSLSPKGYFLSTHQAEVTLQHALHQLTDRSDFTIPNAFEIFDGPKRPTDADSGVTPAKFSETCRLFDIDADIDDVMLVIERYDSDKDSSLGYEDFREMLSPKHLHARRLLHVRPYYNLSGDRKSKFCMETKLLFKKAIHTLLKTERTRHNAHVQLNRQKIPAIESMFTNLVDSMQSEDSEDPLSVYLYRVDKKQ